MAEKEIVHVHSFWFGEFNAQWHDYSPRDGLWFGGDRVTDESISKNFKKILQKFYKNSKYRWQWLSDPHPKAKITAIILLDQFSRF